MSDVTGRCLCGSVTITAAAAPLTTINCHCTECRRATGAAYATLLVCRRGAVTVSGVTKSFRHLSDRGTTMTKTFCPNCGSPLYSETGAKPDLLLIRAGIVEETAQVMPERNVFVSSRIASTPLDPGIPAFDGMPT